MAWFPCNLGGGGGKIDTKELLYSIDESRGGAWINSAIDITEIDELIFEYTDEVSGANYTALVKIEDIVVYTGGADVFTTIFPTAISGWNFNVRIYNDELWVSFSGVDVNTKVVCIYKEITAFGNATIAHGSFTSASTQFGIVDVNVGFKPDLVMVRMKLSNAGSDTTSFWWCDESYAQTHAIWTLYPAESVTYYNELGRTTGETGIQAINNDGFSFMSNGGDTQGCTCNYVAVKFEVIPNNEAEVISIANFTQEYDSSIPFGDNGNKISWLLSNITTIEELLLQSQTSWNDSRNAFYDSEDQTGAYAGFSSNDVIDIDEVLIQLGRYSEQNQSLYATMQYKNTIGTWVDIDDVDVSTSISYPKHLVRVNLRNYTVKGFRFIHKNSPIKSSGNNIIFGGMIALKGSYANVSNLAVESVSDVTDENV